MVDGASYVKAHAHVRVQKGKASRYICVDCENRQAQDWAFRGEEGLVDPVCGKTYSDNVDDYVPVCRSCHVLSDGRSEIGRQNIQTFNTSPQFREQKMAMIASMNAMRRRCSECGLVSAPGGIASHQAATGHVGHETT